MIQKYASENQIPSRLISDSVTLGKVTEEAVQHKKQFVEDLQLEISYTLSANSMIMATSIVSAIILNNRTGATSEEDILKKLQWAYHEILARDGLTGINIQPSIATLRASLIYLKEFLESKKKNSFEPQIKANKDYKNILMLAYYRNNLSHLFINEAYIACALKALGGNTSDDMSVVSVQRLWEQTDFLAKIFKEEFIVRD
jgi:glycerol-3-phosphate O-acyltransferase